MNRELWVRAVFAYLALQSAVIGSWALLAPRSFYDDFPAGRSWVSVDGPYNEHLVRDVGALNLAILVLFLVAALRPTRELVRLAAIVAIVWGLPHLTYHLFNTDGLGAADVVANLGGLALFVVLPATVVRRPTEDSAPA
ncbi:MAG: hypothetical protein AAGA90_19435 [Actinomycetota bacterium]